MKQIRIMNRMGQDITKDVRLIVKNGEYRVINEFEEDITPAIWFGVEEI